MLCSEGETLAGSEAHYSLFESMLSGRSMTAPVQNTFRDIFKAQLLKVMTEMLPPMTEVLLAITELLMAMTKILPPIAAAVAN